LFKDIPFQHILLKLAVDGILLVVDAFQGNVKYRVKSRTFQLNTDIATVAGGMTSQLQVLYVVVHISFEAHLHCVNGGMFAVWKLFTDSNKENRETVGYIG
jgi:hypothetical protein